MPKKSMPKKESATEKKEEDDLSKMIFRGRTGEF
jgi:hypothetical protein